MQQLPPRWLHLPHRPVADWLRKENHFISEAFVLLQGNDVAVQHLREGSYSNEVEGTIYEIIEGLKAFKREVKSFTETQFQNRI